MWKGLQSAEVGAQRHDEADVHHDSIPGPGGDPRHVEVAHIKHDPQESDEEKDKPYKNNKIIMFRLQNALFCWFEYDLSMLRFMHLQEPKWKVVTEAVEMKWYLLDDNSIVAFFLSKISLVWGFFATQKLNRILLSYLVSVSFSATIALISFISCSTLWFDFSTYIVYIFAEGHKI